MPWILKFPFLIKNLFKRASKWKWIKMVKSICWPQFKAYLEIENISVNSIQSNNEWYRLTSNICDYWLHNANFYFQQDCFSNEEGVTAQGSWNCSQGFFSAPRILELMRKFIPPLVKSSLKGNLKTKNLKEGSLFLFQCICLHNCEKYFSI